MRAEIIESMLPDSLSNQALIGSLDKILTLNQVRHKSMMLIREICETQADNASNLFEEDDQAELFLKMLLKVSGCC